MQIISIFNVTQRIRSPLPKPWNPHRYFSHVLLVFLAEARKLFPDARKVLLTAYADTDAAISAINDVGLDHYLMKPWDPPEQMLYPVLDDLLSDWQASVRMPYDGIRIAGTLWSASSHAVKDFLSRSQIPYQWLDIELDETAKQQALVFGHAVPMPVAFQPREYGSADSYKGFGSVRDDDIRKQAEKDIEELWG